MNMFTQNKKDIFISYRNDDSGNHFASRLCRDLDEMWYSVYFNPNEDRGHSFPDRLKTAVSQCKDFVLIVSKGCLAGLKNSSPLIFLLSTLFSQKSAFLHPLVILLIYHK